MNLLPKGLENRSSDDVAEHIPYEEYDEDVARDKVEKARRVFEALKGRYKAVESE
jgi:HEPN domain-containing protein